MEKYKGHEAGAVILGDQDTRKDGEIEHVYTQNFPFKFGSN